MHQHNTFHLKITYLSTPDDCVIFSKLLNVYQIFWKIFNELKFSPLKTKLVNFHNTLKKNYNLSWITIWVELQFLASLITFHCFESNMMKYFPETKKLWNVFQISEFFLNYFEIYSVWVKICGLLDNFSSLWLKIFAIILFYIKM